MMIASPLSEGVSYSNRPTFSWYVTNVATVCREIVNSSGKSAYAHGTHIKSCLALSSIGIPGVLPPSKHNHGTVPSEL